MWQKELLLTSVSPSRVEALSSGMSSLGRLPGTSHSAFRTNAWKMVGLHWTLAFPRYKRAITLATLLFRPGALFRTSIDFRRSTYCFVRLCNSFMSKTGKTSSYSQLRWAAIKNAPCTAFSLWRQFTLEWVIEILNPSISFLKEAFLSINSGISKEWILTAKKPDDFIKFSKKIISSS